MSNLIGLQTFEVDNTHNIDRRWNIYRQEVELFLQASGISSDVQKRAILLHSSGRRVQEIFSTLTNTGTSYNEACIALDGYFKPHKNIIYDRWVFRNAKQNGTETASQFIVRLRKLVNNCEYLNSEEEVRDQFVCGCYDKNLKEKLLRMPNLTMKDVYETSHMYEKAKDQAEEIACENKSEQSENISRVVFNKTVSKKPPPKKQSNNRLCYNCGNIFTMNHKQECPARGKVCNFCGAMGHFKNVCRKAKKISIVNDAAPSEDDLGGKDVNIVENEKNITHQFYTNVFSVSSKSVNTPSPKFKILVNNVEIILIGDTGATCSCINYKTFLQI